MKHMSYQSVIKHVKTNNKCIKGRVAVFKPSDDDIKNELDHSL